MSSVRIESIAFGDERYDKLARLCGLADADHARGKMARLWRQCTIEKRYILPAEDVIHVLGPNAIDALESARLGERSNDGIRLRGTKGRIEWREKLRQNGKKGGRPKKSKWKPSGFEEPNPPATAPVTSPSPVSAPTGERRDPPKPPKGGSSGFALEPVESKAKAKRTPKPKPSDPTPEETAIALRVLAKLTDRTGVSYQGSAPHVRLIANRLREGVTERELRGIAAYCWSPVGKGWEQKPEMHQYLCPETLYGPKTIHRYLPGTRAFLAEHYPEAPNAPSEAA